MQVPSSQLVLATGVSTGAFGIVATRGTRGMVAYDPVDVPLLAE